MVALAQTVRVSLERLSQADGPVEVEGLVEDSELGGLVDAEMDGELVEEGGLPPRWAQVLKPYHRAPWSKNVFGKCWNKTCRSILLQ